MQPVVSALVLWSVLVPTKSWYAPNQPVTITIDSPIAVTLMLTDFSGSTIEPTGSAEVAAGKSIELNPVFPSLGTVGTYLLYAIPRGKMFPEFVGTPLVIEVRRDPRPEAPDGPMVIRIEPLRYAVMSTDAGELTVRFFYDAAPNTVSTFLQLAAEGFYNGLTFHRILPGFVIQGGDPRGNGSGGPGFSIDAEFNDRKHEAGVLSMARSSDPNEQHGLPPRPEYANSGGSQFFIVLDNEHARHLDGRYTAFGRVVAGMDVVDALGKASLQDPRSGRPTKPPVIKAIVVKNVQAGGNPYEMTRPTKLQK